jgi:hypothetical protein
MGIACIKTEKPTSGEEPVFLYHNMVKMNKNKDPRSEYEFIEKIGKGSFSEVFKVRSLLTSNISFTKTTSGQ